MRRLVLTHFGDEGKDDAARVLDMTGTVIAVVAAPLRSIAVDDLRDTTVSAVLDHDFGATIIAGVAFAPEWGSGAIGFT